MKKIAVFFLMFILGMHVAYGGSVVTKNPKRLPLNARQFLNRFFVNEKISFIRIDCEFVKGTTYDVRLMNGMQVVFNHHGEWRGIRCKQGFIPVAVLPERISGYLAEYCGDLPVTRIDRTRNQYGLVLNNEINLTFDPTGKLRELQR